MGESPKSMKSDEEFKDLPPAKDSRSPQGKALPRSAVYLAVAEVFVAIGVNLDYRANLVNVFGLGAINTVLLNYAMGTIYATILTLLATVQWTAFVMCSAASFHLLMLIWMYMPHSICQTCAYIAPVLSMFAPTLDPIRLAFISDQLTTANPSYVRPYFCVIACMWFMGRFLAQLFAFFIKGPLMVPAVSGTILTIFIGYAALAIFIQIRSKDIQYCNTVRFAAKEIYWKHEGNKYWAILHIAITVTGHYAARLIIHMAHEEQMRSLQYSGTIGQGIMAVLPNVLAVVFLIILGFGAAPILKHKNKEITDLQCIGLGMVFGCLALVVTMAIQTYIDKELKPPRRQECLLFLFNLLPSNTTFQSEVFGKADTAFIQVGGLSSTAFISRNVVDVDEYPISVINLPEKMRIETHIQLREGKTVSYIITRDRFQYVTGLDLKTPHFIGKESTMFVGCALNNSCDGRKITFHSPDTANEVELPKIDAFKIVPLIDGTYVINGSVDGEPMTLREDFTTKAKEIHAGMVYEKEPGVPDIALFLLAKPEKIPVGLFILQQSFIAFRDTFFTVGLLQFLYHQTPPNKPARPFVYSAFFFICRGIPYIITGGLRTYLFHFLEGFVVQVYLAYYAWCVILFIHLAVKYEHMKWPEDDEDEDPY